MGVVSARAHSADHEKSSQLVFCRLWILLLCIALSSAASAFGGCEGEEAVVDSRLLELKDWNDPNNWKAEICSGAADADLCLSSHREIVSGIEQIRGKITSGCEQAAGLGRMGQERCELQGSRACLDGSTRAYQAMARAAKEIHSDMQAFSRRVVALKVENARALANHERKSQSPDGTILEALQSTVTGRAQPGELRQIGVKLKGNYAASAQIYTLANLQEAEQKMIALAKHYSKASDYLGDRAKKSAEKSAGLGQASSGGLNPEQLAKALGAAAAGAQKKGEPEGNEQKAASPAEPSLSEPPAKESRKTEKIESNTLETASTSKRESGEEAKVTDSRDSPAPSNLEAKTGGGISGTQKDRAIEKNAGAITPSSSYKGASSFGAKPGGGGASGERDPASKKNGAEKPPGDGTLESFLAGAAGGLPGFGGGLAAAEVQGAEKAPAGAGANSGLDSLEKNDLAADSSGIAGESVRSNDTGPAADLFEMVHTALRRQEQLGNLSNIKERL